MPADGAEESSRPKPRRSGWFGGLVLGLMLAICVGSLPWTLAAGQGGTPRFNQGEPRENRLPTSWIGAQRPDEIKRLNSLVDSKTVAAIATAHNLSEPDLLASTTGPAAAELRSHWPTHTSPFKFALGSDSLGRSLLIRCLTGGGISLCIGLAAATISVLIGTLYGAIAGYAGGLVDGIMMRIVDILYGLPYVLLVVLLAVAVDAALENIVEARVASGGRGISADTRNIIDILVLLIAIGGVSWLTMARVVRGQVLSLKAQPFMEAARAMGVGWFGQFRRHLLPNLIGPIVVYATLTVPQAILQESFLSFLGIGVRPPLPSWGNLAADGLGEINPIHPGHSNWWLLVFPCLLLAMTLVSLNLLGEHLREKLDPKSRKR